jgi:hypothetical protein
MLFFPFRRAQWIFPDIHLSRPMMIYEIRLANCLKDETAKKYY